MKNKLYVLLLALMIVFTFSIPAYASEVGKKDVIAPLGVIHYETFVNSTFKVYTQMLYINWYGMPPDIDKEAGTVTINYKVEWDEIWLVDQFGNKISLETTSNYRIDPSSARRRYNLKMYMSITGEDFRPASDQITLFGFITYTPIIGGPQQCSYNVTVYPQ